MARQDRAAPGQLLLQRHGPALCAAGDHVHLPLPFLDGGGDRSEEHTSELQSPCNLVCRLLLEKKKLPLAASSKIEIVPPGVKTRLSCLRSLSLHRHDAP